MQLYFSYPISPFAGFDIYIISHVGEEFNFHHIVFFRWNASNSGPGVIGVAVIVQDFYASVSKPKLRMDLNIKIHLHFIEINKPVAAIRYSLPGFGLTIGFVFLSL